MGDSVTINFTGIVSASAVVASFVEFALSNSYTSSLTLGRVAYSVPLSTLFAITPPPSSSLSLGSTSNAEVSGNVVLIGENATFLVTISVPYGTIFEPSLTFNVAPNSTETLSLLASSVSFIPSTTDVINATTTVHNTTSSFAYDTLVNHPHGSKQMVMAFDTVVLPVNTPAGAVLTVESVFSFSNGTHTFTQPTQNLSLIIAVARFNFTHTCSPRKLRSGDTALCVLIVYPLLPFPAYNLTIVNSPSSNFTLNPSSVNTTHGEVSLIDNNSTFTIAIPVYDPSKGSNITIIYSTTLTGEAHANADVSVPALLSYLSSPTTFATTSSQTATAMLHVKGKAKLGGGAIAGIVIGSLGAVAAIGMPSLLPSLISPPPFSSLSSFSYLPLF